MRTCYDLLQSMLTVQHLASFQHHLHRLWCINTANTMVGHFTESLPYSCNVLLLCCHSERASQCSTALQLFSKGFIAFTAASLLNVSQNIFLKDSSCTTDVPKFKIPAWTNCLHWNFNVFPLRGFGFTLIQWEVMHTATRLQHAVQLRKNSYIAEI